MPQKPSQNSQDSKHSKSGSANDSFATDSDLEMEMNSAEEEGYSMQDNEIDDNFQFGQTNVQEFTNTVDYKYGEKDEKETDYDQYKYAVGIKYDLKTRKLTFKKVKYIYDEIMTDIRWSKRNSMEFQLALFYIFFLFFFRMIVHYCG